MNERIKQLLQQSTKEVNPDDREWVFSKVDQEKFAELIVRECAQFIEDKFDFCGDELLAAEKLREHFRVK